VSAGARAAPDTRSTFDRRRRRHYGSKVPIALTQGGAAHPL